MSLRVFAIYLVLFVAALSFPGFSQTYHVELNKFDKLADQGFLLEIFNKDSSGKIISPDLKNADKDFITLYFNLRSAYESKKNNVMIIPQAQADFVYVDYNNNNNFTDDGAPLVFDKDKKALVINMPVSGTDSLCFSRFALLRKPNEPDSHIKNTIQINGDLTPEAVKFIAPLKGAPDFKGKAGTFYFVDENNLSEGIFQLNGGNFTCGLYDYTKNGIYNDSTDLFLINLAGGEGLYFNDASRVFKLNDVFSVSSENYKILNCDKYGRRVDIVKTDAEATSLYRTDSIYQIGSPKTFHTAQIDDSLWQINGVTIFGEKLELNKYKGNYVLLNFWGEWCAGCVNELPELTEINNKFKGKNLKIVSFIKANKKDKAIKMIKDNNLDWPQIILDKQTTQKFKIEGYPTNILILPDGKTCYITSAINRKALDQYIK
jgi:thiol-disulfide isomerase/thioredoxin